jgi:hypothetical protein
MRLALNLFFLVLFEQYLIAFSVLVAELLKVCGSLGAR